MYIFSYIPTSCIYLQSFLDLVFIWFSNRLMWFDCVHYCATETILAGCVCVSAHMAVLYKCVYMNACVCGRQAVSSGGGPVCQCGGWRREQCSLYKSGQITEAERPETPFHCPAFSAFCQPGHMPLELCSLALMLAPDRLVEPVLGLHSSV